MSNSTQGGRPLSAEEARWKREAEAARGRVDGQGRMALLLLEVLATLDRERQETQRKLQKHAAMYSALFTEKERLAAGMAAVHEVELCTPCSFRLQDALRASLRERSQVESEARTEEGESDE